MLLTSPVPVRDIFLGKLAAITKITVLTQLWIFALFLISGKLVGLHGFPPVQTFYYIIRGFLGGTVIASIQLLLSMLIRSFATPIAFAIVGSITGLLAGNSQYGIYYPYALMMLGMNANKQEDMLSGSGIPFFVSSLLYLILISCTAIYLLKHQDVVS